MLEIEYVVRDALLTVHSTTKSPLISEIICGDRPFKYIGDIDYSKIVLAWLWNKELSTKDKKIIMYRLSKSKIMSFKKISKIVHSNRESVRREYYFALNKMKDYAFNSKTWDQKRVDKIIEFAKTSSFF